MTDNEFINADDIDFAPELPPAEGRWKLRPLSEATARQTRWLVPGLIPLRNLTLIAGIGGLGKTTWALARAAEGSVAAEPWETIYVSFEDTAEEVLRPRLEAAGADLSRVHELVLTDAGLLDSFTVPRDVDELRALVRSRSARLVVIDPIVAAFAENLDAYKDQHVRQVLGGLWRIAEEEECAVALIGHLNRVPSPDAYLRIANSIAFWNRSRSAVLVTNDESEDEDDGVRLITQRKANLARLAPVERHQLEEIILDGTLDPRTGKPIVTSRMRFVEIATDVDASEVLGPQKTTKTETAEQLLAKLLSDGEWHESEDVKKSMAGFSLSETTVKRAAKDLGVEHERRGPFPGPKTWWRLTGHRLTGQTLLSTSGPYGGGAQPSGVPPDSESIRSIRAKRNTPGVDGPESRELDLGTASGGNAQPPLTPEQEAVIRRLVESGELDAD